MDKLYETAQAAVDQARKAYEFSANSYTFEALNTASKFRRELLKCELLNQRLSY